MMRYLFKKRRLKKLILIIAILFLFLSGCFVLGDSPDKIVYDPTIYNATVYSVYTSDPNWTRARVISSDIEMDTVITFLRRSDLPKNRVIFTADMHESVWGYTITRYYKQEHNYFYEETKEGIIEELSFPYVKFNTGTYNYYNFIYDYRSEPPYQVGDTVLFSFRKDTLTAIKE